MKITCKNFGPLREFSIDLEADFVLIVGENNIGKSYAISLLYAILKTLLSAEQIDRPFYSELFLDKLSDKADDTKTQAFLKSLKSASKDIDVTDLIKSVTERALGVFFADQLEKTIQGTFGEISNLENRRSNDPTSIVISTSELSAELRIANGRLSVFSISTAAKVIYRKSKQHRTPRAAGNETIIYGPDVLEQAQIRVQLFAFRAFQDFVLEASSTVSDVHYLPASRSGLYQALSAFGQIIAELSKRRTFLSQRIELPAIPEPLIDYFLKLNEIRPSKKGTESSFARVADELERLALGGAVEFDHKSKRLFYKPFDVDLKLDLSSTSSMVSEVAPIITYLKHVLPDSDQRRSSRRRRIADDQRRKQIIFIEEPEAHLHPHTQVILMNAFAKLVSGGEVKMIVTTHSNFVFNKLSNLVISKAFGASRIEAFRFVRSEHGTASHSLEVDEFGITDENFGDVAEDLFSEKLDLLSANEPEQDQQ